MSITFTAISDSTKESIYGSPALFERNSVAPEISGFLGTPIKDHSMKAERIPLTKAITAIYTMIPFFFFK